MKETSKIKRKAAVSASLIAIAAMVGACGTEALPNGSDTVNAGQANTYRQIGMDEAMKMMREESDYIILDVRRADEYADGHIPNAINVANEDIGDAEIPELPDKDQLIMVYCRSGRRSKEASEKLVALGYTNIVEFGGILDYTGETVSDI